MATEAFTFKNVSTSQDFTLTLGGWYDVNVHAGTWNSGSVTLEQCAADGTSYVPYSSGEFTTDGANAFLLSPGKYRLAVASATGVYLNICRVPAGD